MKSTDAVVSIVSKLALARLVKRHRAITHQAEEQRPKHGRDGRFRRREPAHGHAADQDDRRHQRHDRGEIEIPVDRKQEHERDADGGIDGKAGQDQQIDDQRNGKNHDDFKRGFQKLLHLERRVGTPPLDIGEDGDGNHHQHGHDDAREDAGHEQGADGDIGHHAVDDEGQ